MVKRFVMALLGRHRFGTVTAAPGRPADSHRAREACFDRQPCIMARPSRRAATGGRIRTCSPALRLYIGLILGMFPPSVQGSLTFPGQPTSRPSAHRNRYGRPRVLRRR